MSDLTPFLQNLRDRLTIVEVVRPHVKLLRKGRTYTGLCPFHKEKSPSFTVNDEKGFYHCFGCGAHGDIFDFVMQKQNMPFMEAVELLANLLGLEVPKRQNHLAQTSDQPKPNVSLYEVMETACVWYQNQLSLSQGVFARDYLEQRGVFPETIALFRLGYAPEKGLFEVLKAKGFSQDLILQAGLVGYDETRKTFYDRFRGRLMFPIWDTKGRVIAFGGRILKEGEPKYLNSPDTPTFIKGKTLYAYHFALPFVRQKETAQQSFIVVEGYMDVIAMHQNGLKGAVAPLGTALTIDQMALLWRGGEDPILCFDGDSAGTRAAHRSASRALEALKVGQTLRFCFLPTGEDPDSLLRQGGKFSLEEILNKPIPLADVLWSIFTQSHLFQTPEQKAVARRDLGELLKEIQDPDVRHFYREEFTNRLQGLLDPKMRELGRTATGYSQGRKLPHKPSSIAISRVSPKNNGMGYKILLATLINHPTLVEDTIESLTLLSDDGGVYNTLRQEILSIVTEMPSVSAMALKDLLLRKGFASLVEDLLSSHVYSYAPFAKETSSREEALAGWQEVWQRTVTQHHLTTETSRTAQMVRDQFDEQAWEKLKLLKSQVVFKRDEK